MPTRKQLIDALKRRAKGAKQTAVRAGGVAREIRGNVKDPNYRKGFDLRLIRGGPGDALLNKDDPDPKLVQKQMMAMQRAAFKDNFEATVTAAAPFARVRTSAAPKIKSLIKHLRNKRGQFQGSRSTKILSK